jgi:secondary thiamine-phosphate synthase enzyme
VGWTIFEVQTAGRTQLVNITQEIATEVERSGVSEGICHVFVPHTTAGVTINEGADPNVLRDVAEHLAQMVPQDLTYRHTEGNSDSHIKTVIVGAGCNAPIRNGKLALGRWQAIFLCEWDGPRARRIEVAVVPIQ